jgi:hypothetical protein
MRLHTRRVACVLGAGALAFSAFLIAPATGAGAAVHTCSGTSKAPGELTGTLTGDVVVSGACEVNAGIASITGDLTIEPNSALIAAFGLNDQTHSGTSSLSVSGDVFVGHRSVLVMGCLPTSSPCFDDPDQGNPTLSSHDSIGINLISDRPLGVIVHDTAIGGSVTQQGGGGGVNCNSVGFFKVIQSPVFSTYEDSTVGGDLRITGYRSCWQGVARVQVGGDLVEINNQLADPDAIEIVLNHVSGDLVCRGNSMVWDSGDIARGLFPRVPQPNTVDGQRIGQCVLDSPTRRLDPPGPGPF